MKVLYTLIILVVFASLFSCETEIEFNGTEVEPVLVVNCLACSDSTLEVKVTASRFFLSNVDTFALITDANVALKVNDVIVESLLNMGQGIYTSTYKPIPGDRIVLTVSAPGYATVTTEDTYPRTINDFQVDSTITLTDTSYIVYNNSWYNGYDMSGSIDTLGKSYNLIHHYSIRFTDPPGKNQFYRLVVETRTYSQSDTFLLAPQSSYLWGFKDIVFDSGKNQGIEDAFQETSTDPMNLFTDDLIDGSTHTIQIDYGQTVVTEWYNPDYYNAYQSRKEVIFVELQPISKNYYLFLKTFQAYDNADQFMAEPVQIHTNVNNGLGIFGTRTRQIKRFVLPSNAEI